MSRVRDREAAVAEVERVLTKHADDVQGREPELAELLAELPEFDPSWRRAPVVVRVAEVVTRQGTEVFAENVVMPPARHDLKLLVTGLNFLREQRGLRPVTQPLFLQPDELALTVKSGPRCLCDAHREAQARRRRPSRLGTNRVRKLHHLTRDVFVRDEWRCTRCGSEQDLHLHEVDGGYVTLCRPCHVTEGPVLPPLPSGAPQIHRQLVVFLQRGRVRWVGFVLGRDYAVLEG